MKTQTLKVIVKVSVDNRETNNKKDIFPIILSKGIKFIDMLTVKKHQFSLLLIIHSDIQL